MSMAKRRTYIATVNASPCQETPAILVSGLRRRFGAVDALCGIDLIVPRASFFALVGPNGAGKSTTVRILSGLISRSSGQVRVLDRDPEKDSTGLKQLIGVVPDFPAVYGELSPRQNLMRICQLRGMNVEETKRRAEEITAALSLEAHVDRPCKTLSHGTRKKTVLAAAMIHAPSLLFLDEPFEGIDPVSAHTIRRMLEQLRTRGVTIFLSSHVMPLVESVATHVAILAEGSIRVSGTLEEAIGSHATLEEALLATLGGNERLPDLEWYQP